MKAVVFERFGEPAEVLSLRDLPRPEPGPGQVRVRMLASPINPSDLLAIRGVHARRHSLPATPGYEGVGVVEAAGPGLLGRFLVGRRVAALGGEQGNWREFSIVQARQAIPLPTTLPVEQAATFFINPVTAYVLARRIHQVPAGEWLLQTAAGSALGRMIVRLGKHFRFRTINVVRRPKHKDELQKIGGDVVVAEGENLDDRVRQITNGRGVFFAVDPVGGEAGAAVVRCLAPAGRVIVYGSLSDQPVSFAPRDVVNRRLRIEGFQLADFLQQRSLLGRLGLVRRVAALQKQGVLTSAIGEIFPLERVRDAVLAAEHVGRDGKILLRIADADKLPTRPPEA